MSIASPRSNKPPRALPLARALARAPDQIVCRRWLALASVLLSLGLALSIGASSLRPANAQIGVPVTSEAAKGRAVAPLEMGPNTLAAASRSALPGGLPADASKPVASGGTRSLEQPARATTGGASFGLWSCDPAHGPACSNRLNAVALVSSTEGWAVGTRGTSLRYDNGVWRPFASPSTNILNAVATVSSTDAWVVGDSGTILHYSDGAWRPVASPTGNGRSSLAMVSPNKGWAVGYGATILRSQPDPFSVTFDTVAKNSSGMSSESIR